MDQNKNAQGQQNWNEKKSQQPAKQDQPGSQPKTDRDQAESARDETRGAGTQAEKSSSDTSDSSDVGDSSDMSEQSER